MHKDTLQWLIPALLAVGVALALWFYWASTNPGSEPPPMLPEESVAPPEPATTTEPLYPLRDPGEMSIDRPPLQPLPPLDQSDEFLELELREVFGDTLTPLLVDSRLIERIVATIDSLPREHIAERIRPIGGIDGRFLADGQDDSGELTLDPENYARYDALVALLVNADSARIVEMYRRFYPLFQKAYVELGYPDGYFNDRAVEVIDHLLEAPEIAEPPALVRPNVLFEYADPELEKLSSGQKLMLRMGVKHAAEIKQKLRELRAMIVATVESSVLPEVPAGAQAISLLGKPLVSPPADADTLNKLQAAKIDYDRDPADADNIIWYGRRIAYAGDYREAIRVFTKGIEQYPDDARMYRHRGHRYISIREFDRAIRDLEQAASLIAGTDDEIEPDGLPNAQNIPISTLHSNIWYHLGLAYYLQHDWNNAWRAFQAGFEIGGNDDNRVSTTHWRYMILRRQGNPEHADRVLDDISADMHVIENDIYHRLCLFYKGEVPLDEMLSDDPDSPTGAAGDYGVANWFWYNGDENEASQRLDALAASDGWSAFGVIAAEADLVAR
jgi:tetratricopeptide (TPR) repeat protein